MKPVLVCTAVVLLMSAVELARSPRRRKNSIEQIYKEANVTPVPQMTLENKPRGRPETKVDNEELKTIVEADPSQTTSELAAGCGVDFGGLEVTPGMEISPADAMDVPSIEFDCEPGCYYMVIGLAPDCPYPYDPYLAPFLFTLYANVYSNSEGKLMLENACTIARWRAVSPPPGSGRHRFLLYVYKQKGMIDTTDKAVMRLQFLLIRVQLSYVERAFDLITPPVAGTLWYTRYPLQC